MFISAYDYKVISLTCILNLHSKMFPKKIIYFTGLLAYELQVRFRLPFYMQSVLV